MRHITRSRYTSTPKWHLSNSTVIDVHPWQQCHPSIDVLSELSGTLLLGRSLEKMPEETVISRSIFISFLFFVKHMIRSRVLLFIWFFNADHRGSLFLSCLVFSFLFFRRFPSNNKRARERKRHSSLVACKRSHACNYLKKKSVPKRASCCYLFIWAALAGKSDPVNFLNILLPRCDKF